MKRSNLPVAAMFVLSAAVGECTDSRGFNWYQARCADRYRLQPGTAEFDLCVDQERRIVEDTQARNDPP